MRKFNEVVKLSNLKSFIDTLPNKEDTSLGEEVIKFQVVKHKGLALQGHYLFHLIF